MPDDSDVSGEAGAPRGRHFWDKAQAIAGLATAVLVALIGGLLTYVYNQWQLSAQQPWQPASPTAGQTVHFDGTSSSCSSSPCIYTWQDDGSDGPGGTNWPLGTGVTLDFTFQRAGTKYVRLTVKDNRNRTSRTRGPTLYDTTVTHNPADTAPGSYAELDLYHGATSFTNTVIHDGFCRAGTYTDAAAC
jgi:PKD domain